MTRPARDVDDPAEIAELLSRRPEVHLYGLGDLEEPFWSPGRWIRRGDALVGIVPLPDSDVIAVYAVSDADPGGTLDLVAELLPTLPVDSLITGPTGLAARCRGVRPVEDLRPHVKLVLRHRSALPDPAPTRDLHRDDVAILAALHACDPGAAFWSPPMLGDETFVGLWVADELVAAAGTHLLSERYGVAAIGGVITHPDHRGRGYGGLVTAGVVRRIGTRATTIGLNMAETNQAARRLYARIGFEECWRYEEVRVL